jgi:hypothetical protein
LPHFGGRVIDSDDVGATMDLFQEGRHLKMRVTELIEGEYLMTIIRAICNRLVAIVPVVVLGFAVTAFAQDATSGSISGTITDSSGAAIKGATIVLTNTDRNQVERTLTTNSSGFYTATSLPLGNYLVKATSPSFATVVTNGIYLHVADALTVNERLKPGTAADTVTVTDQAPSIDLTDATSAGLINSTQISQLVMVTRNYESLVELQPGVVFGGGSDNLLRGPVGVGGGSSVVNFSVNGGRDTSNNWTIDGADNVDRGANLTLYVYPSLDAISEFKTLRGQYSAEYGRNASGQIDVATKSGTNSLHGSAYEYLRNDAFDAAGYQNDQLGNKKAPYRYNDFGFTVGGPVWIPKIYNGRNKTFFFLSENWLREIADQNAAIAYVPTAEERAGNYTNEWYQNSAGTWVQGPVNVCTAYANTATTSVCTQTGTQVTNISPTAQEYLKDLYSIIPVPNETYDVAHGLDPHIIQSKVNNSYPNLDTVVRIDEAVSSKLHVFYRYIHDTFPEFVGGGTFTAVTIPGLSATINNNPGTQQLGKGTYTISPTMVLNVGYAYSNGSIFTFPQGALQSTSSQDIKVALPYNDVVGLIPTISFSGGLSTLGGGAIYTDHGINHQGFADLTKVLHNHTLIFGASIDHYEKVENSSSTGNQGSFAFSNDVLYTSCTPLPAGSTCVAPPTGVVATSPALAEGQSFANFLTGNANGGFSQSSTNNKVDINQYIFEAFAQDNWKVTPRLTLNLGVRYSYLTPYLDMAQLGNSFDAATYSASSAPNLGATGSTAGLICGAGNPPVACSANPSADYVGTNYINGMIFGYPSARNNNQASPYGNAVNTVQKINLAPRVGFAYDLFGDGKTSFRGGYGWAYDSLETSYWETTDFNNPPGLATYSQTYANFDDPTGGATSSTKSTTPGTIQAVPLHLQTPYIQQYSLDMQHQFTPTFTLDLGYFGTHGTHLAGAVDIDQAVPNAWRGVVDPRTNTAANCTIVGYSGPAFISTACDNVLNQIKPYLGYNAINAMRTIFSSNYNGLQAKITKKFTGKSYIDANFTWSKDLTNSPADYSGFIQNVYNINADYGRASDDRKLVMTIDGVYELPWYREQHGLVGRLVGGWEVSAIYAANSGLPLTVTASGGSSLQNSHGSQFGAPANNPNNVANDNAGIGILGGDGASLRVNQIANPNNGYGVTLRPNKKFEQAGTIYFNTGAFQATDPSSTVVANAKRGTINGPGFQTADVGIFRNFRIYDRLVFQLRGEAFNVANHTNVQTIGTTSTSTLFGTIEGYRDARQMQVSGRFDF